MRLLRSLTIFLGALATSLASGCGDPHAMVLRVDPGAYHVRGDYMGSQKRVKLFVERLLAEPLRSGRGTLVVAKLAVLNERAEACIFDCARARAAIGEMNAPAVETHTVRIEAGELRRFAVTFRTGEIFDELEGGIIELDGISPDQGGATGSFKVPFSATDLEVESARN